MALEQHTLDRILALRPSKLLSLGYPDLLIKDGPKVEGADDIAHWHNWKGQVSDTDQVFKEAGIEATYLDLASLRGKEIIADLNDPLPIQMIGQFDAVLDPGTIEHCFNIGQAFQNISSALKIGGYVFHTNPVTMVNHGFWNISPTAYVDWYEANGFEVRELALVQGPLEARRVTDIGIAAFQRMPVSPEASSLVVAQKMRGVRATWPTQTKYRGLYAQAS